jgi:hypothetical protein
LIYLEHLHKYDLSRPELPGLQGNNLPRQLALTDEALLFLAWPPSAARADAAVVLPVITITAWAWASRGYPEVLAPHDLKKRVRRAALYFIL